MLRRPRPSFKNTAALASVHSVVIPVLALEDDLARTKAMLAAEAVAKDGAEARTTERLRYGQRVQDVPATGVTSRLVGFHPVW